MKEIDKKEEQDWNELRKKYHSDESDEVVRENALKVLRKAGKSDDLPDWDRVSKATVTDRFI